MNSSPESTPPESEPPPSTAAPLLTDANKDAWWRKILWVVLAAAVAAPLVLLAGLFISEAFARDILDGHWLPLHQGVMATAVVATAGLACLGLQRGWHRGTMLWGWSIYAAGVIALVVFAFVKFQNVRRSSQDSAVESNLHQLSAASDQYFLENGVSTVDLAHLVGATNYVKAVNTVADETYPVYYTQGITITVTGVAGARTVTWSP